VATGNDIAKVT